MHWKDLDLRQKLPNNFRLLSIFLLCSCLVHILFVACLYLHWQSPIISLRFMPHTALSSPNVVFLPYARTVSGALQALQKQNTHKMQKMETKKNVKKDAKATNITHTSESKKQIAKTITGSSKKEPEKRKKEIKEFKHDREKKQQQPKQKMQKVDTEKKKKPEGSSPNTSTDTKKEEVVYIGQNDKIMLEAYQDIEQQLTKVWVPPIGLDDGLECTVVVLLDQQGNIREAKIAQSSHILTYDIAARNAAENILYPKIFYGKECSITFG